MNTMKSTAIQVQRQKLLANIASAGDERNGLLLKLNDDAEDVDLHNQIAQIEREIAEYESALTRLDASEAKAAQRDSKEARKACFEHLKAVRARLAETNGKTEAITAKLQAAFDALGPLFAQLQFAIENRAADARAILAATRANGSRAQSEDGISRSAEFQSGEITEAFANLVANTGLASTAIRLDPYVIVTAPSQLFAKYSLGDAVAKTNSKLLAAIDARLEAGKAMILGSANV